jgi:hypothetical protein
MIIVTQTTEEPPVEPPIFGIADKRLKFGAVLVDTNGVAWDLNDGPVQALEGSSGFGTPTPEHWFRESMLDGSTHQGLRYPARELSLPVEIVEATSQAWHETDSTFWAGMDPAKQCQLVVTMPDGQTRFLPIRYVDGGDPELEVQPILVGHQVYDLDFIAEDPFWRLKTAVYHFDSTEYEHDFLPGAGEDFYYLTPINTIATAQVTNSGTEPASARWVIGGPFTAATVGVGDSVVTIVANVLAGQSRTIDLAPDKLSIVDQDGNRVMEEATQFDIAAIPPGTNIPLNLFLDDPGVQTSVELQFDPRVKRAM